MVPWSRRGAWRGREVPGAVTSRPGHLVLDLPDLPDLPDLLNAVIASCPVYPGSLVYPGSMVRGGGGREIPQAKGEPAAAECVVSVQADRHRRANGGGVVAALRQGADALAGVAVGVGEVLDVQHGIRVS